MFATAVVLINVLGTTNPSLAVTSGTLLLAIAFVVNLSGPSRDIFNPLAFPMLYVGASFLFPAWLYLVQEAPMRFPLASFAPNTANLVVIALASIMIGFSWPWRTPSRAAPKQVDGRTLLHTGRTLAIFATAVTVGLVRDGAVAQRGFSQTSYGLAETALVASQLFAPLSLLLIALAHRADARARRLSPLDWVLVLALGLSIALTGERGTVIVLLLMLLYIYTRGKARPWLTAIGTAAMLATTIMVLRFREVAQGNAPYRSGLLETLAGDWSVVTYTVGISAAHVPDRSPFVYGYTYLVSTVRQLPSPIANRLLGQPHDTATYRFREMIGYTNPNQGFGYSVPAEGYINFGTVGLVGACLLFGLVGSWLYTHAAWPTATVPTATYAIYATTLPALLRSDSLGTMKGLIYPILITIGALLIARWAYSRRRSGSIAGMRPYGIAPKPRNSVRRISHANTPATSANPPET